MTDPLALSARQLAALFARRALSPVEVLDAALTRIEREEPKINAFILLDRDGARKAAKASEERWGRRAPLSAADGLVTTIKDNILLAGFPTRRGSKTSSDAPATEDSPASARLKEAGCVIVGKTTLPEFGWKGLCDSPLTGITRNPWKLDRSTGGSSGGAAAAAALGLGHCISAPMRPVRSAFLPLSPGCSASSRHLAACPPTPPRLSARSRTRSHAALKMRR